MRRDWWRLALAGVAVVVATGCPDSDLIETGNFELQFETSTVNDAGWACVLMDFVRLEVEPVDGICSNTGDPCFDAIDCGGEICVGARANDTLGQGGIEIVIEPGLQKANFSEQGQPCEELVGDTESGEDFPFQILSDGLYKLTRLQINRPALVDSQGNVKECFGFGEDLTDPQAHPEFQDSLLFRIGENEPNLVRFVIDAQALSDILDLGDCSVTLRERIGEIFTID